MTSTLRPNDDFGRVVAAAKQEVNACSSICLKPQQPSTAASSPPSSAVAIQSKTGTKLEIGGDGTAAPATSATATTTATTPFQLSQRPRQITPPGVTADSSFSISPSNNGDYALVTHSFGTNVHHDDQSSSQSPSAAPVAASADGKKTKNSTAEVSPSLSGPLPHSPEGRQIGDLEQQLSPQQSMPAAVFDGVKSPFSMISMRSGERTILPPLSIDSDDHRETLDSSSWDEFAVLSFMSSPVLKKKESRNSKASVLGQGHNKESSSKYTISSPMAEPDKLRSHHQLDYDHHHFGSLTPQRGSLYYDAWERRNHSGGRTGGTGLAVLPFLASHQRPANMQRQCLLSLPLRNGSGTGQKSSLSLTDNIPPADRPPSSVLTSPHVLYAWLRTRFAAGLVRSSFNVLHDMLAKDYQQAKTLLSKIHQDQPRSETYISELLTLRDHLAGLWCVYAHFALDVGRLTRTIKDGEPVPTPTTSTASPTTSDVTNVLHPVATDDASATFAMNNSGTLRLQMINSPIRPPKRKRKKSTKAAESETQLDHEKIIQSGSVSSPDKNATSKALKKEDEYIPTKVPRSSSDKSRQMKKRPKIDGAALSGKKRPTLKSKAADVSEEDGPRKKTGHWTKAEHERFLKGIELYGRGKWKAIADVVKTRTTVQVKTHGQSYFRDDGSHHIQTIDSTPEQKVVSQIIKTEDISKTPGDHSDDENQSPEQDGTNTVRRKSLRPDRGTVLSYEEDLEDDLDDDVSDMELPDTTVPTFATPIPKSRTLPSLHTPAIPTPQQHPPSLTASPYMGTTSMSNLEDLVLGGGLFSPSEFSQIDKLPSVGNGAQHGDLGTPRGFGRSLDSALSLSEARKGTQSLSEGASASSRKSHLSKSHTPVKPVQWDGFLDDMPHYIRDFFTSVGIVSTDQLMKTPTKSLSEIYMSYQRHQMEAVDSSIAPSEVISAPVDGKETTKAGSKSQSSKVGNYHDIAGFALSILLAARRCPLVGNHHFVVLAMGRMIVSTAPMEITPNGEAHVDVPTAIISSRINSAITASWDGVKSCHGCPVDESEIFLQEPESIKKAVSLLASLEFSGKKLISEDKIRNSSLREEMNSVFSLPTMLRKDAGRPEGFVFNDRHAILALFWELNRWSRLEEKLRTNTSGKSIRLGESPWCQPTYQIEDLPMLSTVDAITDAWNNCVFAKGGKDSKTIVWEW